MRNVSLFSPDETKYLVMRLLLLLMQIKFYKQMFLIQVLYKMSYIKFKLDLLKEKVEVCQPPFLLICFAIRHCERNATISA
jgi:hypothetical protein